MNVDVIILAGGAGTRLWPASHAKCPKQFLTIPKNQTLLEQTYLRATELAGKDRVWVVTLAEQIRETRKVLSKIAKTRLIAEPVGRNSGPAVLTAAFRIQAIRKGSAVLLVLPADHLIPESRRFTDSMKKGLERAKAGESLVTFGLNVTEPRTEYGYIEVAPKPTGSAVLKVSRFIEKPDLARARKLTRTGRHFWNSGMFCWRSDFLISEMKNHCPEIYGPLSTLNWKGSSLPKGLSGRYASVPNLSIDYALMERSPRVEVVPSDFAWSDVGTWEAVHEALPKDGNGNALVGRGQVFEGAGNLVFSKKSPVYLFGMKDTVVVQTEEATLVMPREKSRDLKRFLLTRSS